MGLCNSTITEKRELVIGDIRVGAPTTRTWTYSIGWDPDADFPMTSTTVRPTKPEATTISVTVSDSRPAERWDGTAWSHFAWGQLEVLTNPHYKSQPLNIVALINENGNGENYLTTAIPTVLQKVMKTSEKGWQPSEPKRVSVRP